MNGVFSVIIELLVKSGIALLVFNEIRGLILAGPVLYGVYQAGGTWMALWVGFCSLAGIILSVCVPLLAVNALKALQVRLHSSSGAARPSIERG